MHVKFIMCKFGHHGSHSGYDQLIRYVPSEAIDFRAVFVKGGNRVARLLRYFDLYAPWFELRLIPRLLFLNNNTIYHHIYAENTYRISGYAKWGKRKIIATFHQPPEYFKTKRRALGQELTKNRYRRLDAAIAVSTTQVPILEELVGKGKVHFVPHGIDTAFFGPHNMPKEQKVLTVGNWMRDFELLEKVIRIVSRRLPDLRFEIISLPQNLSRFSGMDNVILRSGITEEELLKAYHSSLFVLLPLFDCTANNAILEAMACGLPMIVSDVGGVRDYVAEDCAFLVGKGAVEDMVEAVVKLVGDRQLRDAMGERSRQHVLRFDWKRVARRIEDIYMTLL